MRPWQLERDWKDGFINKAATMVRDATETEEKEVDDSGAIERKSGQHKGSRIAVQSSRAEGR